MFSVTPGTKDTVRHLGIDVEHENSQHRNDPFSDMISCNAPIQPNNMGHPPLRLGFQGLYLQQNTISYLLVLSLIGVSVS